MRATRGACASAQPALMATVRPPGSCRWTRTRGSPCAASPRISGVASVEPSSTTISSRSSSVCASVESSASRRNRSPLRTGITTLTRGVIPRAPQTAPVPLHPGREVEVLDGPRTGRSRSESSEASTASYRLGELGRSGRHIALPGRLRGHADAGAFRPALGRRRSPSGRRARRSARASSTTLGQGSLPWDGAGRARGRRARARLAAHSGRRSRRAGDAEFVDELAGVADDRAGHEQLRASGSRAERLERRLQTVRLGLVAGRAAAPARLPARPRPE